MDKHFKEHSNIVIPAELDNGQWIDTSWHNDVTASLEQSFKTANGLFIRIWVFEDDENEREMDCKKFMVELSDNLSSEAIEYREVDTIKEVLETVAEFNKK